MWEECMTSKEKYRVKAVTRRQVLEATVAGAALVAAPAFLRHALAADPIKIGIPTVITGGYAILGSQVQRTCRLVKKMTDAKGGVIGRPIEFLFQDTQGDPAMCVRKSQELVERDNCRILTGVIVSSEAAAMLPKLEEWNAVFLSHGNGDGRLTAELFVPRFSRPAPAASLPVRPAEARRAAGSRRAAAPEHRMVARVPALAAVAAGSASASPSAGCRSRSATRSARARTARWPGLCSSDRSFWNPQPPQRALEILGDLVKWQRQGGAPSDQHIVMPGGKASCGR